MLPVKLPHRFDRRALLVSQALAHLRTERGPIVSAHVRFKTRGQQRAHRRKHRLAAVHAHRALWRRSPSRLRLRRLHRGGHWRLGLSGGRERHHRAQSNHHQLLLKFFHAFCRSPHSIELLFLFPPVAVPRTEGHIWERSMSCHVATASCQSTSPQRTQSRNPASSFTSAPRPHSLHYRCPSLWNALTIWTTLAVCRGICLEWRCGLALRGMAAPMIRPLMRILPFILGCLLAAIALLNPLHAQLVRENTPPPQQDSAKQEAQDAASAQTPKGKKRLSQEVQLTGQESWIDTVIDVQAGEHVLVIATGKLRYVDAKDDNGPDGLPRGFKDLLRVLPYNEAGRGALIGLIGDKDIARPFVIGARRDVVAPVSGRLSVGINQTTDDTGDGTYIVRIEVYVPEGAAARVVAKQVSSLPGIDNNLFSKIPRRVADKEGNAGDMVNFLILGSE